MESTTTINTASSQVGIVILLPYYYHTSDMQIIAQYQHYVNLVSACCYHIALILFLYFYHIVPILFLYCHNIVLILFLYFHHAGVGGGASFVFDPDALTLLFRMPLSPMVAGPTPTDADVSDKVR